MTRRASVQLLYESVDISADIAPFLRSLTFTDNIGKADDLQITLHDITALWKNDWFPTKGASLKASLQIFDWEKKDDNSELYCGVFYIDEITAQGPEETVTIKAVSTPVGTTADSTGGSIRHEKKDRTWEASTLKNVATQIAGEHGMKLYFELPADIAFERRDQRYNNEKQSDLAFLQRFCWDHDCDVKVSDKKLVIFQSEKREASASVATIAKTVAKKGKETISSWSFTSAAANQFKACKVSYYDAAKKTTYEYTATASKIETGQTLNLSERVESQAAAESLAKARLRRANLSAVTGSISMMGDVRMSAGSNIDVSGFGVFDGKYCIDTATHKIDATGGYKTDIRIHRGEKK